MTFSLLDPGQVLKNVSDDANAALRVNVVAQSSSSSTVELISGDGSGNKADITAAGALEVDGSGVTQPISGTVTADQGGTWNITNISGTISLPTGAATSANQTNASQKTQIVDGSGNVIASTSNALNVNVSASGVTQNVYEEGFSSSNAPVYSSYSSTNVTTSAYVQLVASTTSVSQEIEIFDSSGQALYLAFGASGVEVNKIIIYPGGNGRIKLNVPASTRVSIKAITGTANVGFITISFYG